MTEEARTWPRPPAFKRQADGRGGLVRVVLVGPPHAGRELFIDELELPTAIYTTADPAAFEWWPDRLQDQMARLPIANDPDAPPVRHVLRIPDDTREPRFVAEPTRPDR
jgi:hypothetical protein